MFRPARSWWALPPILLFVAGIVFWGGFNWALELTNTESFCISCHEMRDNPYKEYRQSIHFSNPSGVRATCPDCHVPREWIYKVIRKIRASNELYHHFLGTIDTREQFLAQRHELAKIVWKTMRETDSRECRNCHSETAMKLKDQNPLAAEAHRQAQDEHKTCIDCHQGIAHQLPEAFLEAEHERFEREQVPCYRCHQQMSRPDDDEAWE